jgi:hypothetical protein
VVAVVELPGTIALQTTIVITLELEDLEQEVK